MDRIFKINIKDVTEELDIKNYGIKIIEDNNTRAVSIINLNVDYDFKLKELYNKIISDMNNLNVRSVRQITYQVQNHVLCDYADCTLRYNYLDSINEEVIKFNEATEEV